MIVIFCLSKKKFLATPLGLTLNFCLTTGHLITLKISMWQIPKVIIFGVENWQA